MKILHITPYFFPNNSLGGTALVVYNICKSQIKKGHQVSVFTTDLTDIDVKLGYPVNREVDIDGIRTWYFKNINRNLAYNQHIFFPLHFFSRIISSIRNFDMVHFHEFYTPLHVWGAFTAFLYNKPYVISPHGTLMMHKKAGRVGRKILFQFFLGRLILSGAEAVVALSIQEREGLLHIGIPANKIRIIPTGIDLVPAKSLPNRTNFRNRYGISKDSLVLIYLGRIHPVKGIELLLDSYRIIMEKYRNVYLIIAGPEAKSNYLKALGSRIDSLKMNRVIFTGRLDDKEKLAAFAAADIYIMVSTGEALPISALEAAASGLPLILTHDCALSEIFSYHAGVIVDSDPESIKKGIAKVISVNKFRERFGTCGRLMIKECFSTLKSAIDLENLYQSCIKN